MDYNRKPTLQEEKLLELLIKESTKVICEHWKDGLMVCPMDDGKMGSLYLFPKGKMIEGRVFGEQVSEFQFTDLDEVTVIASLNLDSDGNLFELDVWKIDFSNLLKFPDL